MFSRTRIGLDECAKGGKSRETLNLNRKSPALNIMKFVQQYTIDKTLTHLALAEEHFKDYVSDNSNFCIECLKKHLLLIKGLSEEGIGFFPGDEIWIELIEWASHIRSHLKILNDESSLKYAEEARQFRKKLDTLYPNVLTHVSPQHALQADRDRAEVPPSLCSKCEAAHVHS